METCDLRHGEKCWWEEGGQSGLTDGDLRFTSRVRCTLALGKGGELGGGVEREWYLQAQKVTNGEKKLIGMSVQFSRSLAETFANSIPSIWQMGSPQGLHPGSALQRQANLKISATLQETTSKGVGCWGCCEGWQVREGRRGLIFACMEQEEMILFNSDVLVIFTLMWCIVGWWIMPWPRQPELKHWIQVLSKLETSSSSSKLI